MAYPKVRTDDFSISNYLGYMLSVQPQVNEGEIDGSLAFSSMPHVTYEDLGEGFKIDPSWNRKDFIVEQLAKYFEVDVDQIYLTASAMEATLIVLRAFLSAGDEVIVEDPTYDPFEGQIEVTGARIVKWARGWDQQFRLDCESLKKLITSKTRMIVLTNGHNPSGMKIEKEELLELKKIAEAHEIPVLFDEVYLPGGSKERDPYSATLSPWFISVGSVSKTFRLDQLRLGWIIAGSETVKGFLKHRLLAPTLSSASLHVMHHMVGQLESLRLKSFELSQSNQSIVRKWIESRSDIDWITPTCGNICFPRLSIAADLLSQWLLEHEKLLLVSGSFFGHPNHIRLAMVSSGEELKANLDKVSAGLEALTTT